MQVMLDKLNGFIKELENIQKDILLTNPASNDATHVFELLTRLRSAVNGKSDDMHITHAQLWAIQACYASFEAETLNTWMKENVLSFCSESQKSRSQLCRSILSFILDCKLISDPRHLNLSSYDPHIIEVLQQILHTDDALQAISQLSLDHLYSVVKASALFSDRDILLNARMAANHTQVSFKELLTNTDHLNPKRHDVVYFKLDPAVQKRLERSALYGNLQFSRSSPVLGARTTVSLPPTSFSLPPSPKDAVTSMAPTPALLTQYQQQSAASSGVPPIVPPLQLSALADLPDITGLSLEGERPKPSISKNGK